MLCFSRAPWSLYLCQLRTWSYVECHPAWESRNPVPFLHGWPVGITVPTHPTAHTTKPQALPLRVQVFSSYQGSHGPLPLHASNATVFPKALNSLYLLVITQKIQKGKKKVKTEEPRFDKGAGGTSLMARRNPPGPREHSAHYRLVLSSARPRLGRLTPPLP